MNVRSPINGDQGAPFLSVPRCGVNWGFRLPKALGGMGWPESCLRAPVCGVGRPPVGAAFAARDGAGPVGRTAVVWRHVGAHVAQNGRRVARRAAAGRHARRR